MLYETLSQPMLLLVFSLVGFCSGFIFDLGNFIKFLFANKKIACVLLDIIQTAIILFLLFLTNITYNYGLIRLFPVFIFITCFALERFTVGKIVAKFYLWCYNKLNILNKRIWRKFKHGKANKVN